MATCRQQSVCPSGQGGELKIHSTQLRMGSNPIADMSGWSHSARKRKLALSPGVALRSTQVRMGAAPSLTHVAGDTRKGRKRKEHVVCLSVTPFGWRRKGRKRKERVVCLSVTPFLEAAPHSKLHRSPSVTRNASVISNGYMSAAVSLPEWSRGVNLRSTPRKCAWVRTP